MCLGDQPPDTRGRAGSNRKLSSFHIGRQYHWVALKIKRKSPRFTFPSDTRAKHFSLIVQLLVETLIASQLQR